MNEHEVPGMETVPVGHVRNQSEWEKAIAQLGRTSSMNNSAGTRLMGFSVKIGHGTREDTLVVLRLESDGQRFVAFVGASSPEIAFIRAMGKFWEDDLDYRDDQFR